MPAPAASGGKPRRKRVRKSRRTAVSDASSSSSSSSDSSDDEQQRKKPVKGAAATVSNGSNKGKQKAAAVPVPVQAADQDTEDSRSSDSDSDSSSNSSDSSSSSSSSSSPSTSSSTPRNYKKRTSATAPEASNSTSAPRTARASLPSQEAHALSSGLGDDEYGLRSTRYNPTQTGQPDNSHANARSRFMTPDPTESEVEEIELLERLAAGRHVPAGETQDETAITHGPSGVKLSLRAQARLHGRPLRKPGAAGTGIKVFLATAEGQDATLPPLTRQVPIPITTNGAAQQSKDREAWLKRMQAREEAFALTNGGNDAHQAAESKAAQTVGAAEEEEELQREMLRDVWMRAMAEEFGEELNQMRERETALAENPDRLVLLIDRLRSGAELFSWGDAAPRQGQGGDRVNEVQVVLDASQRAQLAKRLQAGATNEPEVEMHAADAMEQDENDDK